MENADRLIARSQKFRVFCVYPKSPGDFFCGSHSSHDISSMGKTYFFGIGTITTCTYPQTRHTILIDSNATMGKKDKGGQILLTKSMDRQQIGLFFLPLPKYDWFFRQTLTPPQCNADITGFTSFQRIPITNTSLTPNMGRRAHIKNEEMKRSDTSETPQIRYKLMCVQPFTGTQSVVSVIYYQYHQIHSNKPRNVRTVGAHPKYNFLWLLSQN